MKIISEPCGADRASIKVSAYRLNFLLGGVQQRTTASLIDGGSATIWMRIWCRGSRDVYGKE